MGLFGRSGPPAAPQTGDDGAAFEAALRKDLPRGQKGREDRVPRSVWGEADALGPEWGYSPEKHGLFLGRRLGREAGWSDDRHALTIAGTRAGKGISLIIPNLLLYPGSVLCIDPKGELARKTGGQRGKLGKRVVLDPFGENGRFESGHYNPLWDIDPAGREAIDEAGAVADALIIYDGTGDPHWTSAARGVLRALVLLVLTLDKEDRNLVTVRQLLMLAHDMVKSRHAQLLALAPTAAEKAAITRGRTLAEMMIGMGDTFERVVAGQGEALKDMSDKERESVLSEARTQTQFLDSPALRDILKKSDFSLRDFTREVTSVFLCLPARHMDTHDRWLRVIVNLSVGAFEPRRGFGTGEGKVPILMLLEEFAVLKHMEKLEAAAGQLAGSNVKMWFIVQNLGQLQRHYKEGGWETFIANSGVITAFGNADLGTLQYLAQKLGKVSMNVVRPSNASSADLLKGGKLTQEDLRDAALLELDELSEKFAREKNRVLVLAAGQPPVVLERVFYFRGDRFKGLYEE